MGLKQVPQLLISLLDSSLEVAPPTAYQNNRLQDRLHVGEACNPNPCQRPKTGRRRCQSHWPYNKNHAIAHTLRTLPQFHARDGLPHGVNSQRGAPSLAPVVLLRNEVVPEDDQVPLARVGLGRSTPRGWR